MKKLDLTPCEDFMARFVLALDTHLTNPADIASQEVVKTLVLERPRTVRSALNALLYKSHTQTLIRRQL